MTTVADQHETGGKGKKKRVKGARGKGWNLLWQVPLLVVGLAAFGFGVRQMMRTVP